MRNVQPKKNAPLAVLAFLCLLAGPLAADVQETVTRQFPASSGMLVELENLAGNITVNGTGGGQVEIEAVIHAGDEALAEQLKLEFDQRGDRLVVRALYPVDEYDKFHYPGTGDGVGSWLFGGNRTETRYQGRRVRVSSSTRGAVTLYADFTLNLPSGVGASIDNTVGDITADGVNGDLEADTGSGSVRITNGDGDVTVDTGSGKVEVENQRGDVVADTGSGEVYVRDVVGNVEADTGSGDVTISGVEGDRIVADTGSGSVELENVSGEIEADTGSGAVSGRGLVAHGRLVADTGSGGVKLEGDFSNVRGIAIDTGSGGVTLRGSFPPMTISISTGSGGIDVDLPGLDVRRKEKDVFEGSYQGGGARLEIDTGSGGVRISG